MSDGGKVAKYVHANEQTFEWLTFAMWYLASAEALLSHEQQRDKPIPSVFLSVLVPAVYCLRHSTELLLKFIALSLGDSLSRTHNPHALFAAVGDRLPSIRREQVEKAATLLGCEADLVGQFLTASMGRIETIAAKYHSYAFLAGGPVRDDQAEVFRYPVTIAGRSQLDWERLVDTFNLAEALDEIRTLQNFLMTIAALFATVGGRPFLEVLDDSPE